ncbi:MAG: hypothetical protein AB7F89_20860 [Pirellulaceae bacterium]
MSTASNAPRRGFPLAALFLVLTASGIVAALLGPALRAVSQGQVGSREAILSGTSYAIAVMFLGGTIGLSHYHRLRGFFWGLVTGGCLGMVTSPLLLSPREYLDKILMLSVGGTCAIIFAAIAMRLARRRSM